MSGRVRDRLTKHEAEQLQAIMRCEPVWPGDTLSHALARSLSDKGLIKRNRDGDWIVCWDALLAAEPGERGGAG